MLTNLSGVSLNMQPSMHSGVCHRCQETSLLNAYGLCPTCDQVVDEEYDTLYQEPLELDVN